MDLHGVLVGWNDQFCVGYTLFFCVCEMLAVKLSIGIFYVENCACRYVVCTLCSPRLAYHICFAVLAGIELRQSAYGCLHSSVEWCEVD